MRNANSTLLILLACAAIGGCNKSQSENVAMANNSAAPADIEALPADESSATPSNELVNGAENVDANASGSSENSY